MNRATKAQREKVAQFCGVTGASPSVALTCLAQAKWSIPAAVDVYYSSGMAQSVVASRVNL